jgi:hypothetical protein
VKWKEEGRCGVYMCGKESCDLAIGRLDGERRDSFIANALFKILRKLPPLHVSDFVQRIPLPLQTLTHRSTQLALLQAVYNTAHRTIQQMRQLSLFCVLPDVIIHATPNKRSDTKL